MAHRARHLFLDQKLAERRLPTRDELDTVSSVVPIAIRAGGHVSAVNSRALQLIGFEFDDPQESFMGPATVVRDADGRATGVVSELDSQFPVELPEPGELRRIMAEGIDELYTRRGVTTIGEITETLEGAQAIVDAVVAGEVSSRVRLYLWAPGTLPLEAALDWRSHLRVPDGNERIRVDGVKLFTDGGFSGRTAAMLTPYVDEWALTPGSTGELAMTEAQLKNWLQRILDAGLDPIVHTCGERAQRVLVEVLIEMGLGESYAAGVAMDGSLGKVYIGLEGMPRFAAARTEEEQAILSHSGLRMGPYMSSIQASSELARAGRWDGEPVAYTLMQTAFDDSLNPPGRHLMSVSVSYAPYRLAGGASWAEQKDAWVAHVVSWMTQHVPNLPELIVETGGLTPAELHDEFGMYEGNALHRDVLSDSMYDSRPLPGYTDYTSPVEGLFFCSVGTWPSNYMNGLGGRNASAVVSRYLS